MKPFPSYALGFIGACWQAICRASRASALLQSALLTMAVTPAVVTAAGCCCTPASAARPLSDKSIYQLDDTWTDDASRPVKLADLRGHPVVLTMFFTNCEYACPILVNDNKRLLDGLAPELRDQVRFVLVSFDSTRDTPAALHAYRERVGIPADWMLLRGDAGNVRELAMLLGVRYKQDAHGQFSHSNLITVLNAGGGTK
jgi:protein SCO1/2